jgi:putative membrane protein
MHLLLNTAILVVTLLSPFVAVYAVKFILKGEIKKHQRLQKILFWTCMTAVVVLEMQIRASGGSGSLIKHSSYYGTDIFKYILTAHIIGAVLTYIIWAITILLSSIKFKQKYHLPGSFSKTHRNLGYITIVGLFYTAITALIVYIMTFLL